MKRIPFLFAILLAFVLAGCMEDNITGTGTQVVPEPEPIPIFSESYVSVNPDSAEVEAGLDTFQFKTVYHKVTVKGDSSATLTQVLSMQYLNIVPDTSHYTWLNEDKADSKIALIQIRGQVGDEIYIPVMHLFDDSARTDTVKLIVVAPGTKSNCAPTASFVASPLQGYAPFTTTVTPEFFDPDGDSLTARIETPFDTVTVQDGVPVDFTFTQPGTHMIRLVVDDERENGRVEVEQAIFAQELPPTRLLVKSSAIDSISVLLTGQNYAEQLVTDTSVVLPAGGTYQLVASKSGYLTDTMQVDVVGNENNVVDIHLRRPGQPDSTILAINSDPVDIIVHVVDQRGSIDTTVVAPKVLTLPYGDVVLKLYASKTGYISDTLDVYVAEDQTNNVQVTLQRVVVPDPPVVYFHAVPDTAIQYQQYPIEWQTSNVASATLDGEPVMSLPSGNTYFIPNHLGLQEHVFVAIGDDGSTVIVRDTVQVVRPPLYPSISGTVNPQIFTIGQTVYLDWVSQDLQQMSVSISANGTMLYENVGNSGHLAWNPTLPGQYEVIFSGAGLDGSFQADTVYAEGVQNTTPDIDVSPGYLDFGTTDVGIPVDNNVVVSNLGDAPLNISGQFIEGIHATEFSLPMNGGAGTIPPGGSSLMDVRFEPQTPGPKSAILVIESDDPDEPVVRIPLTGYAEQVAPLCQDDTLRRNDRHVHSQHSNHIVELIELGRLDGKISITSQVRNDDDDSTRTEFYVELIGVQSAQVYAVAHFDTQIRLGETRTFLFFEEPDFSGINEETKIVVYNAGPSFLTFRQVIAHCPANGNNMKLVIPNESGMHLKGRVPRDLPPETN